MTLIVILKTFCNYSTLHIMMRYRTIMYIADMVRDFWLIRQNLAIETFSYHKTYFWLFIFLIASFMIDF